MPDEITVRRHVRSYIDADGVERLFDDPDWFEARAEGYSALGRTREGAVEMIERMRGARRAA